LAGTLPHCQDYRKEADKSLLKINCEGILKYQAILSNSQYLLQAELVANCRVLQPLAAGGAGLSNT